MEIKRAIKVLKERELFVSDINIDAKIAYKMAIESLEKDELYYYDVGDVIYSITVTNNKKYTEDEFKKMCEETPKKSYGFSVENVVEYLCENYGFARLKINISASFNVDSEEYEDDFQ